MQGSSSPCKEGTHSPRLFPTGGSTGSLGIVRVLQEALVARQRFLGIDDSMLWNEGNSPRDAMIGRQDYMLEIWICRTAPVRQNKRISLSLERIPDLLLPSQRPDQATWSAHWRTFRVTAMDQRHRE